MTENEAEPFLRRYADQQGSDYHPEEALASLRQAYSRAKRQPATGATATTGRAGASEPDEPHLLLLSDAAYVVWKAFEREIEPRIGPEGDLVAIKPWASKLPGAVARIAAVCHCGEWLDDPGLTPISARQMELAVQIGKQLIPHAVAAHRLMGAGGVSTAQAVIRHYEAAGWPQQAQSLTEWWRPVRRIVGETSRLFEPVARTLSDHAYLLPMDPLGRGGHGQCFRANRNLSGNPKVQNTS